MNTIFIYFLNRFKISIIKFNQKIIFNNQFNEYIMKRLIKTSISIKITRNLNFLTITIKIKITNIKISIKLIKLIINIIKRIITISILKIMTNQILKRIFSFYKFLIHVFVRLYINVIKIYFY